MRESIQDIARGRISVERQRHLLQTTESLIAQLESVRDPRPKGGIVSAEAEAAVLAAGLDEGAAMQVLTRDEFSDGRKGTIPVVCFAQPGTLDEMIGKMLSQALREHGINAQTISSTEKLHQLNRSPDTGVRTIFLPFVEPLNTLHLRH